MERRHFLALAAAGPLLPAADAQRQGLRLATFVADITPPLGSPLCHGGVKPAAEIVDPLSARGVVILGAGKPIVLCALDWVAVSNNGHGAFREALAEATGTSVERVAVHTVHQHDTPGVDFETEELLASVGMAGAMFNVAAARGAVKATARAARAALERARPVSHLGYGEAPVRQVASNRRILGPDGMVAATRMSSCRNARLQAEPEGTIDPMVRIVSFWNGDAPLAALSYYACHPMSYYGQGGVSYDFAGMARQQRQDALAGALAVHFNGACGNVAAGKYNDGSPAMRPELARRLAAGMERAWENTTRRPLAAADLDWRVLPVELPLRDTLLQTDLAATMADTAQPPRERLRAARQLAWRRRVESGRPIDLVRLRLGPCDILHMPGELFIEYQLAAAAMRPDRKVCMAAYGDNGTGYIGTRIAYSQGGYEVGPVSRVGVEAEPLLTEAMAGLLG